MSLTSCVPLNLFSETASVCTVLRYLTPPKGSHSQSFHSCHNLMRSAYSSKWSCSLVHSQHIWRSSCGTRSLFDLINVLQLLDWKTSLLWCQSLVPASWQVLFLEPLMRDDVSHLWQWWRRLGTQVSCRNSDWPLASVDTWFISFLKHWGLFNADAPRHKVWKGKWSCGFMFVMLDDCFWCLWCFYEYDGLEWFTYRIATPHGRNHVLFFSILKLWV